MLAQLLLHIHIWCVRALCRQAGLAIDDMIEDLQALVGHPDLVKIRENQGKGEINLAVIWVDGVQFAADITPWFFDQG